MHIRKQCQSPVDLAPVYSSEVKVAMHISLAWAARGDLSLGSLIISVIISRRMPLVRTETLAPIVPPTASRDKKRSV